MKKLSLLILLPLMLLSSIGFAQRLAAVDTLNGAETVNFEVLSNVSSIQAVCTEVSGTSDGTLILQGSLDGTSFTTVTETAGLYHFFPNDTLTIVDGAVWMVDLESSPFTYHRVVGTGTAADVTEVAITYIK